MDILLSQLEIEINTVLRSKYQEINKDPNKVRLYFDQYQEIYADFYTQSFEKPGMPPGERPPNQAHMDLYTEIMESVIQYLEGKGLELQQTPRDTFKTSKEYKHQNGQWAVRLFTGTIIQRGTNNVVAIYNAIVPHLHGKIEEPTLIFPESPWIHIIDPYKN